MTLDVNRFFEMVYNDQELQGALNSALCLVAPAIVVELAKAKGCDFTVDQLKEKIAVNDSTEPRDPRELSTQEVSAVAGGLSLSNLSGVNFGWGGNIFGLGSPLSNFWSRVVPTINIHPIKGPSWVKQMAYRAAGWGEAKPGEKRSLAELHKELEPSATGKA
jgi:predicted ribosomally synthesized peptide with nif11-like leader